MVRAGGVNIVYDDSEGIETAILVYKTPVVLAMSRILRHMGIFR